MTATYTERVGACSAAVKIRGRQFVGALVDVRADVRAWIDGNGYGAGDIGGKWRVTGHPVVKALSYNGRLWDANDNEVVL